MFFLPTVPASLQDHPLEGWAAREADMLERSGRLGVAHPEAAAALCRACLCMTERLFVPPADSLV